MLKLFIYYKPNHFKIDWWDREDNENSIQITAAPNNDSYEGVSALVVSILETGDG